MLCKRVRGGRDDDGGRTKNGRRCTVPPAPVPPDTAPLAPAPPAPGSTAPAPPPPRSPAPASPAPARPAPVPAALVPTARAPRAPVPPTPLAPTAPRISRRSINTTTNIFSPGLYINRCGNLRDHIKKCGRTVPDDMFVSMVLSGLGPDWRQGIRYYDGTEFPPIAPINPIEPNADNDPTIHSWINRPTNIPPDFELPPPTPESPPSISARRYIDLLPYTGDFEHVVTPKIAGIARRNRESINNGYLDNYCGQHMVGSPSFIKHSRHMRRPCEITVANNGRLKAYDIGEVCLKADDTHFTIHIGDVLVAPDLQYNLLSSTQLMRCGFDIRSNCKDKTFELYYKNTYTGKAADDDGVFVLKFSAQGTTGDCERTLLLKTTPMEPMTWSHPEEMDLERPAPDGLLRLHTVPTASTSNPGGTGPATMEEEEDSGKSAIAEPDTRENITTPATGWGSPGPAVGPWGDVLTPEETAGSGWDAIPTLEEGGAITTTEEDVVAGGG
ncbi:unnamed protein product [Closterium sp. NIES-54]